MLLLLCFVAGLCVQLQVGSASRSLSALVRGPWNYQIVEGLHPEAAVTATFNNSIQDSGWSFLEIHDNRLDPAPHVTRPSDEEVAYMAGVMEVNLTASLMEMQWQNTMATYCSDDPQICNKIANFMLENSIYASEQDLTDPRWYQVKLFATQVSGMESGYQDLGLDLLPDYSFLFFQLHGDLDDLEAALGGGNSSSPRTSRHVTGSGSCSALVKRLSGNADLLIGHNTWTSYANMLRIYKLYDFKYQMSSSNAALIPGHAQAFPSYPGRLYSGDDFYIVSSGMVTMETSIENTNPDLWKYVTPKSVLENMRVVVANRLANSGKEWTDVFAQDNSGTYNNQWTIVDLKLFESGAETVKDGLLWVLEQMPGHTEAKDQTDMLRTRSYWASYNIPYYKDIFEMSGAGDLVKQYGDWFSWDGAPRAKIFARDHVHVTDVDSLITLMKYNDFKHDDLAACNCTPPYSGENGIAARSDLNPADGKYPFSALGHRLHGAIDMKVTSASMLSGHPLASYASSGPTSAQQPPFQWSTSGNPQGIPKGHPDRWDFKHLLVNWNQ